MTDRVHLLECDVDALDLASTVDRCRRIIDAGVPKQHVALNAAKVVAMRADERLRRIISTCELVSADGQSIVWASRLLRRPLPERVAGIDLMHALLRLAEREGYRVYILGAHESVLAMAVDRIRVAHPAIVVAGTRNGYFSDAESDAVCADIKAAHPHILFVAMSSPRKEYWLAEYGPTLDVPLVMGVGGAVDIIAGVTRRAPTWMRRAGLEWLFRLIQEPRRLWRRYAITNVKFLYLVAAAVLADRRDVRPSEGSAT
jgi:N-acetylglucosaminyldiphosphoundecaprenol N-acetyl-beta-D-mannosaminyltransferase